MRFLVTGGFGYVGGCLAQHLAAAGHSITLGSRATRSAPEWLAKAETVAMDWRSPQALEQSCRGVDVVVHAAGMNAEACAADPAGALAFNGGATGALATAASRTEVKCFIYLSTAHVYGAPLVGTITEATLPRATHPYATSHLAGELAAREREHGGMRVEIARVSNAFGPPSGPEAECWTLLVNDLCRQGVERGVLALRSSGLQRRDFIPMRDTCRAIEFLALRSAKVGETFNVGGGRSWTVLEMRDFIATRFAAVTGARPATAAGEPAPGETNASLEYSIEKLRQAGFTPNTPPEQEIDRLIEYCRGRVEARRS